MTEERLREIGQAFANWTEDPHEEDAEYCLDAIPSLLAEIRRLQEENARLRPVFEKAGKFVEAVNADSFEDGTLYKALNDAVSQWTPSKAKEES